MSLKDIFRPTWKKIVWTVLVGTPITLLGLRLQHMGLRDSSLLILEFFIFLLPVIVELLTGLSPFPAKDPISVLILVALQFLQFYVLICLVLFIAKRMRATTSQRQGPLG